MQTNFGGRDLSSFGDLAPFCLPSKTAKTSLQTMDYSPWSSKNLINRNRLKKFMQVDVDVTCMYTNFGGCSLSGFGDTNTLKNDQISLSDHGLYKIFLMSMVIKKFNQLESTQKNSCK